MPITLNGTTGYIGPDGSAASPAIQGSDANTGMFFPAADTIAFAEGGAEVARFDSSGVFGIGVTPSAWTATNIKTLQVSNGGFANNGGSGYITNNAFYTGGGAYTPTYISSAAAQMIAFNRTGVSDIQFLTAASGTAGNTITWTQAMTLDSSGNLLVGTTSNTEGARLFVRYPQASSGGAAVIGTEVDNTVGLRAIAFRNPNGLVGTISTSGSSTAYNTSSDYRLKEDVAPMTGALARVAALKPVTYKWKVDGSDGEGFIAHELQAVVPDCVSGDKDAVDAEGNPVYQGIDTSFLSATLAAALQELHQIVQAQAAEIAELKAKLP